MTPPQHIRISPLCLTKLASSVIVVVKLVLHCRLSSAKLSLCRQPVVLQILLCNRPSASAKLRLPRSHLAAIQSPSHREAPSEILTVLTLLVDTG
ncbi:hypothetical protein F2Q69_00028035 [Brassica cretica]|uniref:Uncharacterized protein n=1 Tax=Brassica cretica TaxID=69181 RepID=A0A8S9RYZ0_BRACR|nr:hypothetical protein F2Q69_00028035 [Brassica cretica]